MEVINLIRVTASMSMPLESQEGGLLEVKNKGFPFLPLRWHQGRGLGNRDGRYWVSRGGLSSNTERLGGYYKCKGCEQRAGVKGLVFLITRVREGREFPSCTIVGNIWWRYVLLLDRRDRWTLLIFCYASITDNQSNEQRLLQSRM